MSHSPKFTRRVLEVVSTIGVGERRSYKWVAKKAGYPGAHRAVGTVLKRNKNLFIVPCHRVVKSSGEIGGYSLGADIKEMLLDLEQELTNRE